MSTFYVVSNLGTPAAPTSPAVGTYLKEFLNDPLVVNLPWVLRKLLVNGIIVPRRAPLSAAKYAAIWLAEGSPLLVHSEALLRELRRHLGEQVLLGMRYGKPSLAEALRTARSRGATRLVLVPLYPQYAEATSGSTLAHFRRLCRAQGFTGELSEFPAFPTADYFVRPSAELIAPHLASDAHLLLSFHGLPESQVNGEGCLQSGCCDRAPLTKNCYRAHCVATARAIARELGLADNRWTLAFQSRFGRARWIGPATDTLLRTLPTEGKRKLVVAAPSFVADCLETIEELGIQGQEIFRESGGEHYTLVPCLNGNAEFARGLADKLQHL